MARYYRSVEQPFVSQFVPENLELKQGYYEGLQKQQDSFRLGVQGLNKQTDALSNDLHNVMEAKKSIESRYGEVSALNYNDPIERQKALKGIKEIQDQFSPFSLVGAADKKKKDYDALQAQIAKDADKNPMKASYLAEEARRTNLDPSRAIIIDPNTGVPNNREVIPPQDFDYKDVNDEISTRLKDVEFDQISKNSGLTPEQGHAALYSYMSGNIQEKTGEKIYNALKDRLTSDLNLQKSLEAQASYFLKDKSKANLILETALQGAVTGGKFKRSNLDKKYREDELELHSAKQKHDIDVLLETTSTQSEGLNNAGLVDPTKYIEFDKDGGLKPIMKGNWVSSPGQVDEFGQKDPNSVKFVPNNEFDTEESKKVTYFVAGIQAQHPELKGLKPREIITAYRASLKSLNNESIPLESMGNVAAKNIGDAITRNKKQRNFYLWDGNGKTTDGTQKTVLEELNITEEEFDKQLKDGSIGGYTQAGPVAGGYYAEIKNNDGESRRVIISPDEQMSKNIFAASQKVNEARKTLVKKVVQPYDWAPNITIEVVPNIKRDGSVSWEYFMNKPTLDGKYERIQTDLNEIRSEERKALKESPYLGGDLTVLKANTTN